MIALITTTDHNWNWSEHSEQLIFSLNQRLYILHNIWHPVQSTVSVLVLDDIIVVRFYNNEQTYEQILHDGNSNKVVIVDSWHNANSLWNAN